MTFEVSNETASTIDVQLLATGTPRVYAEIPTLGPSTTAALSVTLGPGHYTWQCASITNEITTSNPEKVSGPHVDATPSYIPVTPADLSSAVYAYRASVTAGLANLARDTNRLNVLVDAHDLDGARAQWLVAHLDYERLGAAYDTFGAFDDEINGRATGLPGGVHDPRFTGFSRLEYGLWHDQSWSVVAAVTGELDRFVDGLNAAFPHQLMLATDLPLRAHEVLENALQFELTAGTDEGSHTNLATVSANVVGTQTILDALQPLLVTRAPQRLKVIEADLSGLASLLASYDRHGTWVPVESLTTPEHEYLDASLGATLEELAAVPGSLRLFSVGAN
jgi:high-affinity iron transporter